MKHDIVNTIVDLADRYNNLSFLQQLGVKAVVLVGTVVVPAVLASFFESTAVEMEREDETIAELERELTQTGQEDLSSAEEYLRKTRDLIQDIKKKRYELFYPDILKQINEKLETANQLNVRRKDAGQYLEAAKVVYDTAFQGKKLVLEGECSWHRGKKRWMELCKRAAEWEQTSLNRKVELELSNGDKVKFQASDWCDMEAIREQISFFQNHELPDSTTLREMARRLEDGSRAMDQAQQLLQQGVEQCLDAHDRERRCRDLYQYMTSCGWMPVDCGYEQNDHSKMLLLNMKNALGDKVRFELPPLTHIAMRVRAARYNPEDNQRIARELAGRLRDRGFLLSRLDVEGPGV